MHKLHTVYLLNTVRNSTNIVPLEFVLLKSDSFEKIK